MVCSLHFFPKLPQGIVYLSPGAAPFSSVPLADPGLRLVLEVVEENHFLLLLHIYSKLKN